MGFFSKIAGLFKTGNKIDDDFYEELEESLVMADVGINTSNAVTEALKASVKEKHIKEPEECKELLISEIKAQMEVPEGAYDFENQRSIILFIGVNGVGKTTAIGKLAYLLKNKGKKVLICAADTFRAAAIEQVSEWADRAGVDIVAQEQGSDPAAVVFDALNAAKARGTDVLLIDTAGRLQNKKYLMEELKKIDRVIDRECADWHRETFVVLDGTTGQNALVQAKEFNEVAKVTGIIITKLEGTAKGGIAIAVQSELKVPVKFIGVGESLDALKRFDSSSYVDSLFEN